MASRYEKDYLALVRRLLSAPYRSDRTGVGTRSVFGINLEIDLQEGFPLLTTKKVHYKSVLYELFWFLRGDTNISYLNENQVTIWDEWADENGDLGPIYGYQWRKWPGYNGEIYDQIRNLIEEIKINPYSRRLLVSTWNVGQLNKMHLYPCHVLFQCYVEPEYRQISMQVYQRSADVFLGLPFNVASYATLLHMIGYVTGYQPYKLHFAIGDAHLYLNHIEQANIQLSRTPYSLPKIKINREVKDIDEFRPEDIQILGYNHHPAIKAPIAV